MAANYQYFAMFEELTEAVRSLKPVTYLLVEVEDRVHGHGDPPPPCQRSTAPLDSIPSRTPTGKVGEPAQGRKEGAVYGHSNNRLNKNTICTYLCQLAND